MEPPSENELVDLYMTTFLKDYVGEWNIGLKFKWMKRTTTFIQILHVADRSYLILSKAYGSYR